MIRDAHELADVCASLRADGLVALDTEFVWRNTNRPLLALVQLGAADGTSWLLDCLQSLDTAPLAELLRDPSVVKVLHDARQDLCHLCHYTGVTPLNVFDTQLAAAFAGFPGRMSLQKLVQATVDVCLPKTETVTDWSQRPLTAAQVDYALDDVRYLGAVRNVLLQRTDELGTRAWLEEDLARLDQPDLYEDPDPGGVWLRVKCGHVRLDRRGYAVLRELAATRERCARDWNLPRLWLAEDESLAEMAATPESSEANPRFRHRLKVRGQREALAAQFRTAIRAALDLDEAEWPQNPRPRYLPEVQDAANEALDFVRRRAEEIHVDPQTIASRATVTAWIDNPEDETNPLAGGWRHEQVGREIAARFVV